jgi:hypothetical protein
MYFSKDIPILSSYTVVDSAELIGSVIEKEKSEWEI